MFVDRTTVTFATPTEYRFINHRRYPRSKSLGKFRETIRGKTRRTNGRSPQATIADINRTSRGWFEYFKHCHHYVFSSIDGWVRMRLRSILRRRMGRVGRGRNHDHQRWPNAYFAEQGLFSLKCAPAEAVQSSKR